MLNFYICTHQIYKKKSTSKAHIWTEQIFQKKQSRNKGIKDEDDAFFLPLKSPREGTFLPGSCTPLCLHSRHGE